VSLVFHRVEAVDCRFDDRPWEWAQAEAARIDAYWAGLLAKKPALYDGPVLLMHSGRVDGAAFRGAYLLTRFSRFMAWRDFGTPDRSIRNGFAMAALRSADGAFLLGEMGAQTANAGQVYFPSGTPDPSDVRGGIVDLAGSVARELEEETGIAPAEARFEAEWTVVETGQKIAFLQVVTVEETAEALRARIHGVLARDEQPELARIHVARRRADITPAMPDFVAGFLERELPD
jgi:8-oxo-dGTP pyrophosphatase MutT (NUDIX family)